jgi:mono/diheme cytochrome c family protein
MTPAGDTKSKELVPRLLLGAVGLALIGWLVVQFRASPKGGANVNTNANAQTIQQGQDNYQQFCAGCHDATNVQLVTPPPKLDGLFQRPTLPSGAPATDDAVREVILKGRGIMPPFQDSIGGDDLADLLQYLHTR